MNNDELIEYGSLLEPMIKIRKIVEYYSPLFEFQEESSWLSGIEKDELTAVLLVMEQTIPKLSKIEDEIRRHIEHRLDK